VTTSPLTIVHLPTDKHRRQKRRAAHNTGLVVSGVDEQFESVCLAISFVARDGFVARNPRLRKPRNRYAQGVQRQRPDKKGIDKTPPKEE